MTVQVVHDCVEKNQCANVKQIFISKRGESSREFSINKSLIQEEMILPAAFSLSFFNAPIALASIACGLKSGYSTIFPSKGNFYNALLATSAPLLSEQENKILLVYGDELVPPDYGSLCPPDNFPLAFAILLSNQKSDLCKKEIVLSDFKTSSPADFLKAFFLDFKRITA